MPSRRQVHAPMADQGSAEVMGSQARDRLPKEVMDRLHWDIARAAAIAPPLLLLRLGLPPAVSPTAPAIGVSLVELDDRFDYREERWLGIGFLGNGVAVVVWTERQNDVIRIISARRANRYERQRLEQYLSY